MRPSGACRWSHLRNDRSLSIRQKRKGERFVTLPIFPNSDQNRPTGAVPAEGARTVQLHRLFEAHARRSPHHPAVRLGGREWSYVELNTRANRIAHHLKGQGLTDQTPVGLCLPSSFDFLAGALGIFKAGGLCV